MPSARKLPQFNLDVTKVWGAHTLKLGGFQQTTDNFQSTFSTYQDGDLSGFGVNPDIITGNESWAPLTKQPIS